MRKITKEAVHAFMENLPYKNSNTEVNPTNGNTGLFLHENMIAFKIGDKIEITLAGWNTKTTRERLNGIPGVSVYTRKGIPFLNGNPINDTDWYTI
jgi:hypothetical protein